MAMELVMEEIVPNQKFVPLFKIAATPNVIRSTGICKYAFVDKSNTVTIMTTASTRITFISFARAAESRSSCPTSDEI